MKMRFAMMFLASAAVVACGGNATTDHGHDHASEGHGHSHGEEESWAVTAWGEHFGLFPEVDLLLEGHTAGAHVHVTLLDGFRPVTEGSVTIVLENKAGKKERFSSTEVVRPGIFDVKLKPKSHGVRTLLFEIEAGGLSETIPGGRVEVGDHHHPGHLVRPPHDLPDGGEGDEVSFLLEQQWKTAFGSQWAEMGSLKLGVSGTARIEPPSGGEVVLTAPVDGAVRADRWPFTGQRTTGGSLISIIPTAPSEQSLDGLAASVSETSALSAAATARVKRLESLLEQEAVSRREFEQAKAEAAGLEARSEAAKAELAAAEAGRRGEGDVRGIELSAPFVGRVAEVLVSPGEHVAVGTPLIRVVRERPVWVRAAIAPIAASRLSKGVAGLVLDFGASADLLQVSAEDLRLVAVAPEVDARTGTVEALIEVQRSVDELKPGLHATAQILLSETVEGVVLPDSAIVDDAGVSVVYVQLDGETFSRRLVGVTHRQGDLVLVEGVLPGERIVTVGGAAIRRASLLASGEVHGHVH